MSVLKRARSAQWPLIQEFVFNYNDGVYPLASLIGPQVDQLPRQGVTDLGSQASPAGLLTGNAYTANPNTGATYFDVISLPPGAQVIGGDVQIEMPYVGPGTATLALGTPNSGALYYPATTLKATAFTNQPTTLTNATAGNPTLCTMGNATANGLTALGQTITITGCTGASAAYNGTFTVDSYTATSCTFTNPNLTTALTLAGTIAATFIVGRTALLIPDELTGANASGAGLGVDVRASLTFSGGQAATQGRVRVRVMYTIDGRSNEVQPN